RRGARLWTPVNTSLSTVHRAPSPVLEHGLPRQLLAEAAALNVIAHDQIGRVADLGAGAPIGRQREELLRIAARLDHRHRQLDDAADEVADLLAHAADGRAREDFLR